ncbi:hypothetical protein B0I33_103236 [Prauserella shujinwangii]|uniref:Putative T7SS secretion signal domain-containing protein n=1 Tax=Prauserella shujinwangii TaxID=1453103 RepID=A0A2T0LYL2_9PSEU|nr:hypothetical protein [Prauserella shujinwangii]PRX49203.1 hypothetical protein B0I33_103236 [Prauserella shujinwangii]
MAELGETEDPAALVEGKPEAIEENARVLRARADRATRAGEGLKSIDTGAWSGEAANAFRDAFDYEPVKWIKAGDALTAAADALDGYAATLRWAQGQAAEAIRLWNEGNAATQQAKQQHEAAVAQATAQNKANAAAGNPTCLSPGPFVDPGEATRQAAREVLNRARQQLTSAGDQAVAILDTEADTAPENKSWGEHALDFGAGMWNSVSTTASAGADLLLAVADPGNPDHAQLTDIASAAWHNITNPVDTAKNLVAWDEWEKGNTGRALGEIGGNILVGGAAGRMLKGGRPADGGHAEPASPNRRPETPEEKTKAVHDAVLAPDGRVPGVEDSKGVYLIPEADLNQLRQQLHDRLGEPTKTIETPKGQLEYWQISDDPKSTVTYRSYSNSGGATIDLNEVQGLDAKRFHISKGEA